MRKEMLAMSVGSAAHAITMHERDRGVTPSLALKATESRLCHLWEKKVACNRQICHFVHAQKVGDAQPKDEPQKAKKDKSKGQSASDGTLSPQNVGKISPRNAGTVRP